MAIEDAWYQDAFWVKSLRPFSWIYRLVAKIRRLYYESQRPKLPIPVIVVGNITVGGTGKTPLVIALIKHLQRQGRRVGVVSRGYGGKGPFPLVIKPETPVQACGDEPFLIHLKTGATVVCAPKRLFAAQMLIETGEIDVIISDDGLQHYALDRQFEVCVVDGARQFGNGLLLPAGPLREPVSRLETVDCIVVNGQGKKGQLAMHLKPIAFVNLKTGQTRPLSIFNAQAVSAVCAIGNPQRFVDTLTDLGCEVALHPFKDHHVFCEKDLHAIEGPIIMTEKDAVKCVEFATAEMWVLSVEAQVPKPLLEKIDAL